MRKISYLFTIMLMLSLASCKKDNSDAGDARPVTISVQLSHDAENTLLNLSVANVAVKVTNLTTSQVYTVNSDAAGTAEFKNIAPGNYDVSASLTMSAADYNAKAGTSRTEDIVFNGTLSRQSFNADGKLALGLVTGRIGDLVIKQIYYAGSNAANGAVFRDQFVEIYNNSNATIYADSLYFGQTVNVTTVATKIDFTKGYYLTGGQYDWSKSVGMTSGSKANSDYVYMASLYMIPGTGKQYPILPGKSIIIAATAQNHQSPYTGTDGKTVSVKDPSLTVDLSKADFEVYQGDRTDINPLASDLDNPSVPNLVVLATAGRDLVLDALGRDGLVIFKSATDPKTWSKYPTPDVVQVTVSTKVYIQVPVGIITDGVGLNHASVASRIPKYMNDIVDAGEIFTTGGSYSSQSVVRKTSKAIGSTRVVLMDTNNSGNDFGVLLKADATKGASSFIN